MMGHIGNPNVAVVHQVDVNFLLLLHIFIIKFFFSQMPFVGHVEGFAGYLDKVRYLIPY